MRKLKTTVLTSIILLSFGIIHPSSIKADEVGPSATIQIDMSEQKAPTSTQSIAEFTEQINKVVDTTKKIKEIFPDTVLAQAVADSLSTTVDGYIDTNNTHYRENTVEIDIPGLVENWTGMSIFKGKIARVAVVNQGKRFDEKALILLKTIAREDNLYKVSFIGDGITDETFNKFIDYFNETLKEYIILSMDSNYIHDLTPLTNYKYYNKERIFINNQFGAGKVDEPLTVKDNKIIINNDELDKYRQMPTGQKGTIGQIIKTQMFDTDNSRSVYSYLPETGKFQMREMLPTPIPTPTPTPEQLTKYVENFYNNLAAHNIDIQQDPFWYGYGKIDKNGTVNNTYADNVSDDMITQEGVDYANEKEVSNFLCKWKSSPIS